MRAIAALVCAMHFSMATTAGQTVSPPDYRDASGRPASDAERSRDPSMPPEGLILHDLLPHADRLDRALQAIRDHRDDRFIAPLLDVLRFVGDHRLGPEVLATLRKLTGLDLPDGRSAWGDLIAWYAGQDAAREPPGYLRWKGEFYARMVDPAFRRLFPKDAPATVPIGEIVWGGVGWDGLPPLNDPKMITGDQARYLEPTEPVFGVSINGDHRAYPLRILDCHEMANDVVGGIPVSLAYCTLCGAGILYEARLDGRRVFFRSSGFLFRSNKLMCDTRTSSLWNHMTGKPVVGELAGKDVELNVLPIVLTSWQAWSKRHPETKVLSQSTGHRLPYRPGAYYGRYYASPELMFPVKPRRDRRPLKQRIFVLRERGKQRVYPLPELGEAGGVINDAIDGLNVVIVLEATGGREDLPGSWLRALDRLNPQGRAARRPDALTLALARSALRRQPGLVNDLSPDHLLAMPVEIRLFLLSEFTSDRKEGTRSRPGRLSANLRNEVAVRGLIADVRAYDRAEHTFSRKAADEPLVDERGRTWRITEKALISTDGARLPRLSGHLAYWFGWNAFHEAPSVYRSPGTTDPP